ncbi:Sulfatase precursor [Labilithrix luteola]|uniref:Sulfatase n=2 Tax=Labilithrix luteola TaxID=1391654 RepID=A0A0K1Q574_9BACT|nr:Sulfatase precursor [Labilithrix luteola]
MSQPAPVRALHRASAMSKNDRPGSKGSSASGNGHGGNGHSGNGQSGSSGKKPSGVSTAPPRTYLMGTPFPGRIGRTYDVSQEAFPVPPSAPKGAPNILYIVLDDVGFGWTSTFGGLIDTPHITRLADNGLRYVNFHTTALCSPTRACLLTGRNHHSVGMANITELATGFPGYNGIQPPDKAAIGAILHTYGYNTFAVGKWHNTMGEEMTIAGPYDRWPDGPLFGFDQFYGFIGGDNNQWYPKLYAGRTAIDQPKLPEQGYHLSEDLVDQTISFIGNQHALEPSKPWLTFLAFGAGHSPHHVFKEWSDKYKGKFDMGWDKYREQTLERQKKLGLVPPYTELPPMLEGVQKWDSLTADQKRLYARMAEVYAGFVSHADAQIGRLLEFLETSGMLDDTLIFVFIGDNGSSGEGTLHGLYNEMSLVTTRQETEKEVLDRIDNLGLPGSYNHYPIGWALAGDTPFRLCKQYTHFGGTRNPLVVHWPKGIKAKGELRTQFHHVIDIVPTILDAVGVKMPEMINSVQQAPMEGVPMNYSFDDVKAPTNHPTQYFEMLGNRAIVDGKWKAVTYHGRKPWENRAAWGFDEDHWELYDLEKDPSECHDLMAGRDASNLKDPMVKKMIELVGLWWAEAGRHNVLPLDDRFQERALARKGLVADRSKYTFFPGTVRVHGKAAPNTINRSWSMRVEVEIPPKGASGPLVVIGGDTNGWSLYLKESAPTFCYNLAGMDLTYIRGQKLPPGKHVVEYEFQKTGKEPFGAGGIGRILVGGKKVAEGNIPQTTAFDYSLDETFDIGCDKGSPVTTEYPPLASFDGKIIRVDMDLKPDFATDEKRHHQATFTHAILRE